MIPFDTATSSSNQDVDAEEWISEVMVTKGSDSPLKLQRFREAVWVLIDPIVWMPSKGQSKYKRVEVPQNFVTDLASIPRVFWSLMPRDGEYAYPAIVHDFLYWEQSVSKAQADEIFKMSMEDLEIPKFQIAVILKSLWLFGQAAWDENAKSKAKGEKRILKYPPSNPRIKWSDWKVRPELFV